jgi:divalent anion:Na+ symporter, DASS family
LKKDMAKLLLSVFLAGIFFIIPSPLGLEVAGWHLLGIFVATILALVLQPMPEAVILIFAITAAGTLVVPLQELLVGYTDTTLWLIVVAVMISIGLKKSGLVKRVGLLLISKFGTTSLRLGYILSFMDFILATSTPAAPARGGGIVFPLAEGVIEACNSKPGITSQRIGSYMTVLLYMVCMITGSIFMTGMGPNLLNVKLAQQMIGIQVTWSMWSIAALPSVMGVILIPYLIYKVYTPELKSLETVRDEAIQELKTLGKMTTSEYLAGSIFLMIFFLWATGAVTHIDATVVSFLGISLMFLCRIITWKDIVESREVWSMLMWFGGILGLSIGLSHTGFFSWFTIFLKQLVPIHGLGTYTVLIIIALLATIPHYFFASLVAYVAAFAPLIFSLIAATDVPRYPAFFLVAYLMVISSTLTHYGNGLGPLLFGKGYVDKKTWWLIGLMVTIFFSVLYLVVGPVYWKIIGIWY